MVKVRFIGSRACILNGIRLSRNDTINVSEKVWKDIKTQGFELVSKEKTIKNKEVKTKKSLDKEEDVEIKNPFSYDNGDK